MEEGACPTTPETLDMVRQLLETRRAISGVLEFFISTRADKRPKVLNQKQDERDEA